MDSVFIILIISILGPILGSLIGVIKSPSKKFMFNMLAFAAGVMLTISFLILLPQSINYSSGMICALGIASGALIMFIIDKLIPHVHPELCRPDDMHNAHDLRKSSVYITTGLFIHNIPEGMVIAIGALSHTKIGLAIAIAMAVQKIPEGICTSAPRFYSTNERLKSFLISCMTIIPILIGFAFTYYIYSNVSFNIIGFITGIAAGLMIYISADELIPNSSKKFSDHNTVVALIIGVLFVVLLNSI
jgi:zinc transporter, ZIP family